MSRTFFLLVSLTFPYPVLAQISDQERLEILDRANNIHYDLKLNEWPRGDVSGFFYQDKELRRIEATIHSVAGTRRTQYYFSGKELLFIEDRLDNDSTNVLNSISRYFFRDDKLIHCESEGKDPFLKDPKERVVQLRNEIANWKEVIAWRK